MLYAAQMGVAFQFFHPVRDINGNFVAGQAANVSKSLLGPDRLAASAPELAAVTLTNYPGVTGWVLVTVTLSRLGQFTLTLTNPGPPTTDDRITDYDIVTAPGISVSTTLLTSLDRVRTRMGLLKPGTQTPIQPGDTHPLDSLINLVISEVSEEYQDLVGRTFIEQTYTEYIDGSCTRSLMLTAGPLVSITSVESVQYLDDGAGGVTESRTVVPRSSYVLAGLRSQPRFVGRGRLDLVAHCGLWLEGKKRYRVIYVAGFAAVPEAVVGLATEDVVSRINNAQTGHLLSQVLGDGQITFMRPQQLIEMRTSRLATYLLEAA
jgi:hypothetical protein